MSKCPDCNSVTISPFVDEGDGKCDKCHGTGLGDALDQFAGNLVGEPSNCTDCYGTGRWTRAAGGVFRN